ncbi:MAG: glycine cleavage system protein GcvH [Verrucomicrobia bacterium]|jgi:glycine cleavage system H protein|nr:glycine cleavage system protein GcvH [Verrucomicrobiota bacterium]MDA1202776.1 glycine cleavage system protein GcvH [Verrucomicrobiota bacterium]
MNVPQDLKYAETHEWIRVEGDTGVVGITDHAQNELTDIVYVDPPKLGATVTAGQAAAVVESVKAASDIYSPVDGEVIELNDSLSSQPALVNTSPYDSGWLYKVRLTNPLQLEALKSPDDYRAQIG